jgi:DNA-binding winged helix-turn-helix (wHTH) protein
LLLDKEARKVTIDGRECLLRNLEFRLLLMFVEKENHILGRDEIKTSLWNETVGVDNRVNNLLSTLRKALKDFPEYQITLEGEDRYVLSMPAKVDS